MLHFCLRYFYTQVLWFFFCLHFLLQLNSIATNSPWITCSAFKSVLRVSSYIPSFISLAHLSDKFFLSDLNATVQGPFLMCVLAEKQLRYLVRESANDGALWTPDGTSFHQRDLHGETSKWYLIFYLPGKKTGRVLWCCENLKIPTLLPLNATEKTILHSNYSNMSGWSQIQFSLWGMWEDRPRVRSSISTCKQDMVVLG